MKRRVGCFIGPGLGVLFVVKGLFLVMLGRWALIMIVAALAGLQSACVSEADVQRLQQRVQQLERELERPTPTSIPAATPVPTSTSTPPPTPTASVAQLIEAGKQRVALIETDRGCGSGVLLGRDGLVLTNYHVVENAFFTRVTTIDGTEAFLNGLAYDEDLDLALLQAASTVPEPSQLELEDDRKTLSQGDALYVIGYPDCDLDFKRQSVTVTSGILSSRLNVGGGRLQTDAALNPGVSGGPAFTRLGRFIGMAVEGYTPGIAEGVGLLIPAGAIKNRLTEWLVKFERGTLGTPAPQPRLTTAPTPQPTIAPVRDRLPQLSAWWEARFELRTLRTDYVLRRLLLIWKEEDTPGANLDEWSELQRWFRSDDGTYGFIVSKNRFPRFREVRDINDRLADWVENEDREALLYIEHLESGDSSLYDQSHELRLQNNRAWSAIRDAVEDLRDEHGF